MSAKKAQRCAPSGKWAAEIAATFGVSTRKIEMALTVSRHATPDVRAAVDRGELSINAAYKLTQERRRHLREGGLS